MFVKASEFGKQTVLCYFILQHRAEWKTNIARVDNSITNFVRTKSKPKQTGGQRIVHSQIHFIFFFFYNPGPPCRSLKAECKANCLNKPDYRYRTLQSVSPHIEKRLAPSV